MKPGRVLVLLLTAVLVVTGCSSGDTGDSGFQFVSPGGTTDIFYDDPDRQSLEVSGEALFQENQRISTADFPGKVVVLNIWGSWCAPCRREAPELQEVYERTKAGGAVVLGIAVREVNRKAPQDFMRDRGLTYPSIYDPPGRTLLQLSGYPRNVVPSTIVLDKQHRVAAIFLRPLLAEDLLPVVQRLTREGPKEGPPA